VALIRNVTGLVENLDTTDNITLVGAINELLSLININKNSIQNLEEWKSGTAQSIVDLQNNLQAESTARSNADAGLQNAINNLRTELMTEINKKVEIRDAATNNLITNITAEYE
jgi:hypothetical protein